jgi:hypothetical protein
VSGLGALPGEAGAGALHDALTHVVDETAAICETIGRELLGYGAPPVAAPAAES